MSSNINIDCDLYDEDCLDNQVLFISFAEASEDGSYHQKTSQLHKEESKKAAINGISKSSFSFETQSITNSFADISGSFSDFMISQTDPSLDTQPIETADADITYQYQPAVPPQSDAFSKQVVNKQSKPEDLLIEQQSEKYSQEYSLESYNNYQKSFYMQPYEPLACVQSLPPKPAQIERTEVAVIFRVTNYFLEVGQLSVLVDGESLKNLYDQFFNKQIYVPIFNYERYENWAANTDKDKYSLDFQSHKNFKVYLERYVSYLNQRYPKEFLSILKTILEIQQTKSTKKIESRSFLSFGLTVGWIIDYVKDFMVIHKTETLRKTLLAKINSMKVSLVYCLSSNSFKYEMEYIKKTIQKAWYDLGNIQLLISFETTEQFCSKKIQSSPEAKFKEIWNKYREDIRLNKAKFVKEHLEEFLI